MGYVSKEQIEQARRIDLLTYMRTYEPQELVHVSGNTYCLKAHDSLKISNGKWYWWSRGIGGITALDYLVKVEEMSFTEAVERLSGSALPAYTERSVQQKSTAKELALPKKSPSNYRTISYLRGRGIDKDILNDCIKKGILYESEPYHNAVFVGLDASGQPRYGSFRATNSTRIMGDRSGSDKRFSFRLDGTDPKAVHLFECAIDALSYASLLKQSGRDWQQYNLISLAGVYKKPEKSEDYTVPISVIEYLKNHPQTAKIFLHLDNDETGRGAALALKKTLEPKYTVIDQPPPVGKDINDYLKYTLRERSSDREER